MQNKKSLLLTLLVTTSMVSGLTSCGQIAADSNQHQPTSSGTVDEEEFIVKFNNNYDGTVIKVIVQAGKTVVLPENPTRPGYIFVGWYLDYREDTTQAFDANAPITANLTVYAKWQQNMQEHIVTLHYQDKVTSDASMPIDHGKAMEAPADPVYPDGTMAFTGWYTDPECTTPYDFANPVNSNIDLYAGWKVCKATITFNYNYTGAANPDKVVVDLDVPMEALADPTRDHYAFLGWFDRAVGGNKFDFTKPITADTTLYAQWEENEFLVTFDLNGGTLENGYQNTVYIEKGKSAAEKATAIANKTTFAGHEFKGWFAEKLDPASADDPTEGKEPADLSEITRATTFYAGWALATYTVSFNLNYTGAEGAPAAQSVKYGKTASEPKEPTRDGFIFGGWFLDADCKTAFTFDMAITGNTTLYCYWIDENAPHEPVTVTYYVDGEVYATKTVVFAKGASTNAPADPEKENAIFGGWYSDSSFETAFNMNAKLIQDASVYARFLNRQTFEVEATNLNGKYGMGTSTNSVEEGMLFDYHWIGDGTNTGDSFVSNGFFIRELYYNGASVDFEIESSKEVFDAVMYLRVSSEHARFESHPTVDGVEYNYLSSEEFKVVVNGDYDGDTPLDWIDYPGLYMPMANLVAIEDLSEGKTPFMDCFISKEIHLVEGMNYISFYVDNNYSHGGTFRAEAPMIDCMYLYSDAELSMFDWEYYTRPNVNVQG